MSALPVSEFTEVQVQLPEDEMRIKFAKDETIVFASSSGHCNLDCSYCIVNPIVKLNPSLTYEDLRFVHESIGGKVFFIFSGRGDFFAGYRKSDRLLARLLDHDDIGVALDVNGVVTHCFEDLTAEQLAKVRHVNLTYHYRQLVDHKALKVWKRNALMMLHKADGEDFFVNIVLSPPESHLWEEAMAWYEENIFREYPKKIILINDVNMPLAAEQHAIIAKLHERHGKMIRSLRVGNFESVLKEFDRVSCPAGQSYFRVWNDGKIESCPNVDQLKDAGNAKERVFHKRTEPFLCTDVRYCDCYHISSAGQMMFQKRNEAPIVVNGAPQAIEPLASPATAPRRSVVAWLKDLGRR
jgi:MoaA/NifB/PqqE/SkfB family radical SAM enzyme